VFFTACSKDASVTKEKWQALKLDMTLDQVEEIMDGSGEVNTFAKQNFEGTFYKWEDPNSSDYIFIGILNGKVSSMSSSYY